MKRSILVLTMIVLWSAVSTAQLRVIAVEKLPLDRTQAWSNAQFSPDGKAVFLTTQQYAGIWQYSFADKSMRLLTTEAGSGYGFAVSPDGNQIAYRRTMYDEKTHERTQEIVTMNTDGTGRSVLAAGRELSVPVYHRTARKVIYTNGAKTMNLTAGQTAVRGVTVLGIENTKIVISVDGVRKTFDPLPNGSYIWPSVSPDNATVLAYDMTRGAFTARLDGTVTAMLGKRDAPVWTRSGKWIVFMTDKDDGNAIVSSEINAIDPSGTTVLPLTQTGDRIELFPACSPVENKIVYNTPDGDVFIMTYEE